MRRCSASSDMELIRFCTLTMPTTRPLSVIGIRRQAVAGGQAADGGAQRVLRPRHLEGARHDRLHIAVAVVAQRVHDALPRDDAHQLRAAHHGKILLQRVHAAVQGVGERVRGRERGKVGEHHLAHAHGIDDRLEEDPLIFDLRADHDEEAGEDEPGILRKDAAQHGDESQRLAQAGSGAPRGSKSVRARKCIADQPAAIERIGGQQMKQPRNACIQTRLRSR